MRKLKKTVVIRSFIPRKTSTEELKRIFYSCERAMRVTGSRQGIRNLYRIMTRIETELELRKKLPNLAPILILILCLGTARAQEKISPAPYWSAVGVAAGATFLDAGTTSLIKTPACHEEIGSAWLYGANPQPARTFLQMGAEVGAAAIAAHVLRKHHSRLWIAPLAYLTVVHGRAGISNLRRCE